MYILFYLQNCNFTKGTWSQNLSVYRIVKQITESETSVSRGWLQTYDSYNLTAAYTFHK